jgi:hypothetical protein
MKELSLTIIAPMDEPKNGRVLHFIVFLQGPGIKRAEPLVMIRKTTTGIEVL